MLEDQQQDEQKLICEPIMEAAISMRWCSLAMRMDGRMDGWMVRQMVRRVKWKMGLYMRVKVGSVVIT
jgi:hypothetical protein